MRQLGIIASSITKVSAPPVVCADADGQAFITAVGTLDSTEEDAICALVQTLKSDGIWSKCYAIYPFVGTTEAEQMWNLKDPRDLDAAYRLGFGALWTHSITGAQMDTTLASADTFFDPNSLMTVSDAGATVACRSNSTNSQYAFANGSGNTHLSTLSRTSLVGGRVGTADFVGSSPPGSVAEGVITITRSGTTVNAYKDSTLEGGPTTVAGGSFVAVNMSFGSGDTMEFCFGVLHEGLNATEVANLHAAIDTYSATFTGRKNW